MTPYIINNVLPPVLHQQLQTYFLAAGWKFGWVSSQEVRYPFFHLQLTSTDSKEGRADLSEEITVPDVKAAWEHLRQRFPDYTLLRCYANAQTYGLEGFAHTDSDNPDDLTCILYFCREWYPRYGGETVVYDEHSDIVASAMPRFNRAFIIPANSVHQARAVTRECRELRVTLMFKLGKRGEE